MQTREELEAENEYLKRQLTAGSTLMSPDSNPYPPEELDEWEDDGTMVENVAHLAKEVIGHRILSAEKGDVPNPRVYDNYGLILTLDNGKRVSLCNTGDCCAYTELEEFFLDPASVDHKIMGVGTTGGYTTWHIYADWGDILKLQVGWSCGNPFYYGYGFSINVQDINGEPDPHGEAW